MTQRWLLACHSLVLLLTKEAISCPPVQKTTRIKAGQNTSSLMSTGIREE